MKTIHLTLTGITVSEVLKTLHENELTPTYIGTDQKYNLLFTVSYANDKEGIIQNMLTYINDFQQMEAELLIRLDEKWTELSHNPELGNFVKKPFTHMVLKSMYKN